MLKRPLIDILIIDPSVSVKVYLAPAKQVFEGMGLIIAGITEALTLS